MTMSIKYLLKFISRFFLIIEGDNTVSTLFQLFS